LASATGADAPSLQRLLRMLAGEGVFQEVRAGEFALTPLGETLRSDSPNSVLDRALYLGAPEVWAAWGDLRHSVMTGGSAYEHVHGVAFYAHMAGHPQVGAHFNRWMTRSSEIDNAAVVAGYDFSPFRTVVAYLASGLGLLLNLADRGILGCFCTWFPRDRRIPHRR
jgi:hypothetical protein